ncbi:hypothetical protein BD413DRAFT_537350 [Trametes elegans]|nr:hypothetical protein BD413DRAFT_537350 [Trametes elegans]
MQLFCPPARRFAVIQMDPVRMVQPLDDPIALAAAQELRTKKYLVYLRQPLELPTPSKPWFRYEVIPIATTLRPEDQEKGITPDMVIPISSNADHPRGRAPIQTETPFPFPNCFHWIDNHLVVRVRRKEERYDDVRAVTVSLKQDITLERPFAEDYARINAFHAERLAAAEEHTPRLPDGSPVAQSKRDHDDDDADRRSAYTNSDVDTLPDGSNDDPSASESMPPTTPQSSLAPASASADSVDAVLKMDFFGAHTDDTAELIPLVDLWFELTDHLNPETIPSPLNLYREREAVMRIIHDARERAPSVRSLSMDDDCSYTDGDSGKAAYSVPVPKRGQPLSTARSPAALLSAWWRALPRMRTRGGSGQEARDA